MPYDGVIYLDDTSFRQFSPRIWHDCPIEAIKAGRVNGIFFRDDFQSFPSLTDDVTSSAPAVGFETEAHDPVDNSVSEKSIYHSYRDVGVQIRGGGLGAIGFIHVAGNDAANDEAVLRLSKLGTSLVISEVNPVRSWFEARVRVGSIADDRLAFFVGFSQQGATENALLDSSGEVRNDYLLGFRARHVNGGTTGQNAKVDFIYRRISAAVQVKIPALHTLVVDEYVNVGWKFNAGASGQMKLTVYVNNVENSIFVPRSEIEDSTIFPVRREYQPILMTKTGSAGVETTFDMDSWAFATLD